MDERAARSAAPAPSDVSTAQGIVIVRSVVRLYRHASGFFLKNFLRPTRGRCPIAFGRGLACGGRRLLAPALADAFSRLAAEDGLRAAAETAPPPRRGRAPLGRPRAGPARPVLAAPGPTLPGPGVVSQPAAGPRGTGPPRPPRRLNAAVPAELETLVQKALAKEAAGRYATARGTDDAL